MECDVSAVTLYGEDRRSMNPQPETDRGASIVRTAATDENGPRWERISIAPPLDDRDRTPGFPWRISHSERSLSGNSPSVTHIGAIQLGMSTTSLTFRSPATEQGM